MNITREFIEQLDVIEPNCYETDKEEIWYEVGLIHGLEIADAEPNFKNIWHDAKEEPQNKNKCILAYSEYFDYFFLDFPNYLMIKDGGQNKDWETVIFRSKISKWLYLEDLLLKEDENN